MVRTRRLTSDAVFQPLGDVVLLCCGLAAVAVILACSAAVWVLDALQNARLLGRIAFAVLLVLVAAHFSGCATAPSQLPRDPRDPDVWRPTAPAVYPLPR